MNSTIDSDEDSNQTMLYAEIIYLHTTKPFGALRLRILMVREGSHRKHFFERPERAQHLRKMRGIVRNCKIG